MFFVEASPLNCSLARKENHLKIMWPNGADCLQYIKVKLLLIADQLLQSLYEIMNSSRR